MFKKALQIVVTFGVLVGAYQVYLVAFALLTGRVGVGGPTTEWVAHEGKVAKEATRLAVVTFGAKHWAADPKLNIRLYDAERGFFMYAGDYERLEKGKKLKFWPFAIIWLDKGGKGLKTATSAEAHVELNEPLGLAKPGAPAMHVIEASLEQDVILRDDKGTPLDRSDDTVVDGDGAPLPYIEYSEKTSPAEIRTKSHVRIVDQKLKLTGTDLLISMRKPPKGQGGSGGFDAETAILRKDNRVLIADAGKGGVMPGQVRGKADGPTPTTVRSDGEMRVDLPPKPRALRPWEEGPPDQEGPTYVTFRRNVEVARGSSARHARRRQPADHADADREAARGLACARRGRGRPRRRVLRARRGRGDAALLERGRRRRRAARQPRAPPGARDRVRGLAHVAVAGRRDQVQRADLQEAAAQASG